MPGWIIECKGCREIIFTGIVSDTLDCLGRTVKVCEHCGHENEWTGEDVLNPEKPPEDVH